MRMRLMFLGAALLVVSGAAAAQQYPDLLGQQPDAPATQAPAGARQAAPASGGGAAAQPATGGPAAPSTGGTAQPAQPAAQGPAVRTVMPVGLVEEFRFTGERTVEVRGRFRDPEILAADRRLGKVHLRGSVAYEDVAAQNPGENRVRSSIVWTSVNRDDIERRKALSSPLQTSLNADVNLQPAVAGGSEVAARGDVDGAVSAARSLFEEGFTAAAGETGEAEAPPEAGAAGQEAGGTAGPAENQYLSDWEPPEPLAEEEEPPPEYGESSEGCGVRIDLARMVAIQQTRMTENGSPVGECTDSFEQYPIQASYADCGDQVDRAGMVAYPTLRRYYTNGKTGERVWVDNSCRKDEETSFALREETCPIIEDLDAGTAEQQMRVVYTDRQNALVEVEGCATTKQLPMEKDYAICEEIVSLGEMTAIAQYRRYYDDPESGRPVYVESRCTPDDEATFEITWDNSTCEEAVDVQRMVAYGQGRRTYTNTITHRTETVDTACVRNGSTMPLVKVTGNCEEQPNYAAGVYEIEARLVYQDANGTEVQARGCEVDQELPIVKHFGLCEDDIQLEERFAYYQFQRGYVDPETGEDVLLDDACIKDDALKTAIVEDPESCTVAVDLGTDQAWRQSRLVYKTQYDATKEVQRCRNIGDPIPVQWVTDGCGLRTDMAAQKTYVQRAPVYELDGELKRPAPGCVDQEAFPHQKFYGICPNLEKHEQGIVVPQYRVGFLDAVGTRQLLTECAPDDTAGFAIQKQRCPAEWIHDIPAGQTFGKASAFYDDPITGERIWLTQCQKNLDEAYDHVSEPVGWEHFDGELLSRQKSRVFVDTVEGRIEISAGAVRTGAAELPYTYVRSDTRGIGDVYYEGCTKYQATEDFKVWQRNDGVLVEQVVGAGPVQNMGNACTVDRPSAPSDWMFVSFDGSSSVCTSGYQIGTTGDQNVHYCPTWAEKHQTTFQGTRRTIREDGVVVAEETATRVEVGNYTKTCSTSNYQITGQQVICQQSAPSWTISSVTGLSSACVNYEYCNNHPPPQSSTVAAWLSSLGW